MMKKKKAILAPREVPWLKVIGLVVFLYLLVAMLNCPILVMDDLTMTNFKDRNTPINELLDFKVINKPKIKGYLFVEVVKGLMRQELDFGWLPNDTLFSPAYLLDNRPNFQLGKRRVLRETVRVLRDNISSLRTTGVIDEDVDEAMECLANSPTSWIWPPAEFKYSGFIKSLSKYQTRLSDENDSTQFYTRSDNLIDLMCAYAKILGSINTKLLQTGEVIDMESSGDKFARSKKSKMYKHVIPWYLRDDDFYRANGIVYTIYHVMVGAKVEFYDVLVDKNCLEMYDEILRKLSLANFSPTLTMFWSRGSLNDGYTLAGFSGNAKEKIQSLIKMLDKG